MKGEVMKISVEFPDTIPTVCLEQEYLKKALVSTLYNLGKLSEKEACTVLSLNRRSFEELLPQFGFSILADNQANIQLELSYE